MVTQTQFRDVVTTQEQLREIVGEPHELALRKQIDVLDEHCRAFIALSPFLLLGTSNAAGTCDVSPKGDVAGFVQVLDEHTLVIPDRPGNRRMDSLSNIVENPNVGVLFIVPGVEETLRVNGAARIVRDADVLERCSVNEKAPKLAIAVEVREAFLHCPKCFKRSKLWDTETWRQRSELASFAQMLIDQTKLEDCPVDVLENLLTESHKRLY